MIKHGLIVALRAAVGFMIAVGLYFSTVGLYWSLFPYKTAEIVVPMDVVNDNNEVIEGEKLVLFLEIDKQSDYTPVVSRNIVCETEAFFVRGNTGGNARPRGVFTATVSYELPEGIPLDKPCTFIFINEYKVNPIRTITRTWVSEPFKVIKGDQ